MKSGSIRKSFGEDWRIGEESGDGDEYLTRELRPKSEMYPDMASLTIDSEAFLTTK
jgi:hypothetical protein